MAVELPASIESTFGTFLRRRASENPDRALFRFIDWGDEEARSLTYGDLLSGARAVGARVAEETEPGDRVLLLYEPGLDYVEAFFGCLYSGRIAVPVYPPDPSRLEQTLPRLMHIVEDAEPAAVATTSRIQSMAEGLMSGSEFGVDELAWCATDGHGGLEREPDFEEVDPSSIAFLQYTSGSTRRPRGVRVTHRNLFHNVELIRQTLGVDRETVGVSWLPMYHDMGLIGKIVTPMVVGCRVVLMSPRDFLREPVRWLEMISEYGGTVSAAPNFAYELCVRKVSEDEIRDLDLSSWKVALNGAEPVRAETLESFAQTFEPAGFDLEAFLPAYGLAESTLLVTGTEGAPRTFQVAAPSLEHGDVEFADAEDVADRKSLVSSGAVPGERQRVRIVDPDDHVTLEEKRVGEIWVSGPSVADGYWKRPDENEERFRATLADGDGSREYLRTGDLGFRVGDDFVVTGRLEDLMIIRGRNIYPQDVEATVAEAHDAVRPGGMAAFTVRDEGRETPVVVAEIERRTTAGVASDDRRTKETLPKHEVETPPTVEEVAHAVREAVAGEHRIELEDVVLIKPGSVPKTSSGKIQRNKCRKQYLSEELDILGQVGRRSETDGTVPDEEPELSVDALMEADTDERIELLVPYLTQLVAYVVELPMEEVSGAPLTRLGVDSLAAMEIQQTVEQQIGVRLFPSVLLGGAVVEDVAEELADAELDPAEGEVEPGLNEPSSEVFGTSGEERSRTETITFQPGDDGLSDRTSTVQEVGGLTFSEEEIPDPGESREDVGEGLDASGEPLSYNERGFWLYQETNPESWAPNLYVAGRIPEGESYRDVVRAVRRVWSRHPGLRSRYPTREGIPFREYESNTDPEVDWVDARDWSWDRLKSDFEEASEQPFDLREGPVARIRLYRRRGRSILFVALHHIVADFWSLERIVTELGEELSDESALSLPELTYSDFVEWQDNYLESERGEQTREFWEEQLSGTIPKLEFPSASTGTGDREGYGRVYRSRIDPKTISLIDEAATANETTRYTVLLAAYQTLLYRWTGQPEFFVGAVSSGRTRSYFRDVVGMFANPLPLRSAFDPSTSFQRHLDETKRALLLGLDGQDYPLQAMLEEFDLERQGVDNPIIQTLFASEQPRGGGFQIGDSSSGLDVVDLGLAGTVFDLTVMVHQSEQTGEVRFQYNDAKFDEPMIERLATAYKRLLRGALDEPDTPVGYVPIVEERDVATIIGDWGRGPDIASGDAFVHELLEARAAEHPDRVALEADEQTWSYADLNRRANRIAHRLREAGVETGQTVGVGVERSPELIAALYGVLKAGATYVALQPSLPAERLEYMARDAGVAVTLTDALDREGNAGEAIDVSVMDDESYPDDNPGIELDSSDLAYILYTSGTTGRPKGVMLPHRAVRNLVAAIDHHYPVDGDDVVLQKTPYSFDISVSEIFNPIAAGARLVMTPPGAERDPRYLNRMIREHGVTVLRMTPTELANLLETDGIEECRSVRRVLSCGEALTPAVRDRFFEAWEGTELINLWGPTEACVYGSWWSCEADGPDETIPIGVPLANYSLYNLDDGFGVVPVGAQGELYTGGPSLARGYHELPKKTATAYVPDPHADAPGARMYKTGDLVRWNDDGQLEFFGRTDDQIQLRGLRVELGEIESHLEEAPGVQQAAVRALEGDDGRYQSLAAYVVVDGAEALDVQQLRNHLARFVDQAKVPSHYVELDEMPKTPSGKIDRQALPDPDQQVRTESRTPPRGPVEERIAEIWKHHLELDELGVHENFFAIGGHSLVAVRIHHDVTDAFGVEVPLDALFDAPTVAEFAELVDSGGGDVEFDPIERHDYGDEAPLSAGQRRMWFVQHLEPETVGFNVPGSVRLRGDLDVEALERAMRRLVGRHEILRTVFPLRDEGPVQKILESPDELPVEVVDLSDREEALAEAEKRVSEAIAEPFDLTESLPFRVRLLRLDARDWVLGLVFHHIAIDEWTAGVLLEDLEAYYEDEIGEATAGRGTDADRTAEWRQTWELTYSDYDLEEREDPTLNTDGWVDSYDEEPFSDEVMRDWLEGCLEPVAGSELGRVLEIGCGTGMVLFELAEEADAYVGVDFAESALGYVDAVLERERPDLEHVELRRARADQIDAIEGSFDTVVLNSVVQYFPDVEYLDRVLRLASRKLTRGGRILIGDVRDRRLGYAFHAAVARHRLGEGATRDEIREEARSRLLRDRETLVDPDHLIQLARGLPGISHVDVSLQRAEHRNEMSKFRYEAVLYAGGDRDLRVPTEVVGWNREGLTASELEDRVAGTSEPVLVTSIPNARVFDEVLAQGRLHGPEVEGAGDGGSTEILDGIGPARDPDDLRELGESVGSRVTVAPGTDRLGLFFDAVFEPDAPEDEHGPVTPSNAPLAGLSIPEPTPSVETAELEGRVSRLWRDVLGDDEVQNRIQSDRDGADAALPPLSIQYADYSIWQRERLEDEEYREGIEFWRQHLEGVPQGVDWPMPRPEESREGHPAGYVEFEWSPGTSELLREAARESGTSLFVASYAVFAAFLAEYTGQRDIAVGLPVTMRQRPELRRLVGFFVNTIPMRARIPHGETFADWFDRARETWTESGPHQWVPLDKIVEESGAERTGGDVPLLDVMFIHLPEYRLEGEFDGLEMDRFGGGQVPEAKTDLEVEIRDDDGAMEGFFKYDSSRFSSGTVRRMARHFERFVERCLRAPDEVMGRHRYLEPAERERLTGELARGPRFEAPDRPVHELIDRTARERPEACALKTHDGEWSYDDLRRRSNRLAHRLREEGVRPGDPVGVAVERSAELVAALLGVNKAGGAYVALEPSLPRQRLAYMLRDAEVEWIVTDEAGEDRLQAYRREPGPTELQEWLADELEVDTLRLDVEEGFRRGRERLRARVAEADLEVPAVRDGMRDALDGLEWLAPERLEVGGRSEPLDVSTAGRTRQGERSDAAQRTDEDAGVVPLSPDQRRLWLVQRVEPENVAYVVPEVVAVDGGLDADALRRAALRLLERHEVLRSRFPQRGDGPVQEPVPAEEALRWSVDEDSDPVDSAGARIERWTGEPFDLTEEAPVRFHLVQGEDRTLFGAIFHHIATDEWSSETFWRELEALYRDEVGGDGAELDDREVSFRDYAVRRAEESGEGFESENREAFWKSFLADAPAGVDWPSETTAAEGTAGDARHVEFEWDRELVDGLEEWTERTGVSPFFGLYATFAAAIAHYTGQQDLTIGVPVTNRQGESHDDLVGFFLNPLPMRTRWSPAESLDAFTDRTWSDWRRVVGQPEVSVDEIVSELDARDRTGATPLFDVIFTAVPPHGPPEQFADHPAESQGPRLPYMGVGEAKCALNVGVEMTDGGLRGSFVYDADRLDRGSVERMVEHFEQIARFAFDGPERPFREFGPESPRESALEERPDATMVDRPAFVAVDEALEGESSADRPPEVPVDPDDPIYILYTSGTTGRPKGVSMPHRAVANHVGWLEEAYGLGETDVSLLKSSYGFDMSVSELFGPLTTGGTMAISRPGGQRDPAYLVDAVEEFGVTCLRVVPTALNLMLTESGVEGLESTLRWVMLGGEALTPAVRDRFFEIFEDVELHNPYGITETCVDVTEWRCSRDRAGEPVSLGRPMGNYDVFVLDETADPVPEEVSGEMNVAGAGLAHGYRNKPARTARAFVPNPYGEAAGARMYRSGDLATWDDRSELRYFGRRDDQLQVRGVRVEVGEIEANLEEADGVRQAVVLPVGERDGTAEGLKAFYVPREENEAPSSTRLRAFLENRLRQASVPGRYIPIDELPRNPSGKVDRGALEALETEAPRGEHVEPESETEQRVAEIWADVLDRKRVSRDANFFEVGGNSLGAIKVHRRLQSEFADDLEVVELFEHTTVRQLAEYLEHRDEAGGVSDEEESERQRDRGERRRRAQSRRRRRRSDEN